MSKIAGAPQILSWIQSKGGNGGRNREKLKKEREENGKAKQGKRKERKGKRGSGEKGRRNHSFPSGAI